MITRYNVPQASADAAYGLGFADRAANLSVREFHDDDLFAHYMRGYNDAGGPIVEQESLLEVVLEVDPDTPADPPVPPVPETPVPETPPEGGTEPPAAE